MSAPDGFVTVARVGEIPVGTVKVVRLGDQPVAVFHLEDGYCAIDDLCTHDGGPLAEGHLEGHVIECPRHGAKFNVKTGAVLSLPAVAPVPTYDVRVRGDEIQVGWGATEPGASLGTAPGGQSSPRAPSPAAGGSPTGPGAPSTGSAAPSQQEVAIRSALETVMDPEIALSVIDLGLIREIRIEPGKTHIRMMLTTPFCPYAPQLIEDVKQATQSVLPQDCEVEVMPDAWSPELMPDPGLLGFSY
ncbi:MAG TPA: Rieske 2Fe-2S domain-containing protein [Candidatus Eisenbacteria bacterium]|jgi:nitrite reductase/ring-hydroxylating ferredoxin subunit/metal-sulfur cluster biosynthetic enzyme